MNPRLTLALVALAAVCALALSACGGGTSTQPAQQAYAPVIKPADFSATVDNRFLPLRPGTTFIYQGTTAQGPERVVVTVTRAQRKVMGVNTTVVYDVAAVSGKPVERTYDWYAQDRHGNVWYFGEDAREYKHGKWVRSGGSWEGGVHGAQPGIVMQGHPRAGQSYRQEYLPRHAEDMAKVVGRASALSVPYGSFKGLVVTEEHSPLEPGVVERKYYAPGIGEARTVTVKGGADKSELVAVRHR